MKKIKGYNIVKEKTNELLVSIEIGNDEVIEKDGYRVIPFYEEPNEKMQILFDSQVSGKTIQHLMSNGNWRDVVITEQDLNCDASFYRIKTEETITIEQNAGENRIEGGVISVSGSASKYRPFNNCSELQGYFLKLQKRKTGLIPVSSGLDIPYIWVKHKRYGTKNLIIAFDNDNESIGGSCVFIQDMWVDMKELFDNFTLLDDSPCGLEE